MQVHDEVAHVRIVHGPLSGVFPGGLCGDMVGKYPDNVDLIEILKPEPLKVFQFSAKYQMEQLFLCHNVTDPTCQTGYREAGLG